MSDRQQVERIVFRAIDSVNEVLLEENALPKDGSAILVGAGAYLDSMGFINFIVALEDELAEALGLELYLAEELNAPANNLPRPLKVGDVVDFVTARSQA